MTEQVPKISLFTFLKHFKHRNFTLIHFTGERDYIHIEDLADGHIKALSKLEAGTGLGFKAYNLGTGNGYTVLEVIKTFKEVSGREIKYEIVGRRSGDIDSSYADATLAKKELHWVATRNLVDMCK